MAKFPPITEKTFNAVKILLKGGAKAAEISDYLGISRSSIDRIKASETFEEFLEARRAAAFMAKKAAEEKLKEEKQKEEEPAGGTSEQVIRKEQSVTIIANHYMAEELRKQTELLTLISNKLAFIVEQLS